MTETWFICLLTIKCNQTKLFSDTDIISAFSLFPILKKSQRIIFDQISQWLCNFLILIFYPLFHLITKKSIFTARNTCGQITHLSNGFTISACIYFQKNIHFNLQSRMFLRYVNEALLITQFSKKLWPELMPVLLNKCRTMPKWRIKCYRET